MRIANPLHTRSSAWLAAATLIIGNLFLHKPISDVCDALYAWIGRGPYERVTLLGCAALSAGGALVLLRGHAAVVRRPRVAAALLALAVATVTVQRWLLVSNVELIHLPQFGLLAALFLAAGLDPQTAWIGATLCGVVDEAYQYLVIYAQVPGVYFDYNDVVLNTIGAAWAVVFAAGAGSSATVRGKGWRRALLAGLLIALGAALWLAPLRVTAMHEFPYWRPMLARAKTGLDYHVMSASEGLAVVLLLWGLVAMATGGASKRPPIASARGAATVWIAFLLTSWTWRAPAAGAAEASTVPTDLDVPSAAAASTGAPSGRSPLPFIVTFWCGPPLAELTDARAAEIAAAGFNVVGAPCEGAVSAALNRQALEVAARHGLALWITDPRVEQYDDLTPDWEKRLVDAVADYGAYPALGGYFLVDEPNGAKFADLARVVARLQAVDPRHVPYINLLPDFASPKSFGTSTYGEYLEQFLDTVRPPLLSVDYYPFLADTDRATFFDNLARLRAAARAHNVPFLLIVQAMPHGSYRDPTEAELAWQVHHALAFGARGISYFAYWTPVHVADAETWHFRHGLVEGGQPTEHFRQAARLNRDARLYAAQLDGLQSIGVADSAGRFGTPLPVGPLAGIDGAPVTAGFFVGKGTLAVLLVNQDYRTEQRIALQLRPGMAPPQVFDIATARWHGLADPTIALAPGGAQLLRWS